MDELGEKVRPATRWPVIANLRKAVPETSAIATVSSPLLVARSLPSDEQARKPRPASGGSLVTASAEASRNTVIDPSRPSAAASPDWPHTATLLTADGVGRVINLRNSCE